VCLSFHPRLDFQIVHTLSVPSLADSLFDRNNRSRFRLFL